MTKYLQILKKFISLAFLLVFILLVSTQVSYCQARIIINNASFININNGSFLVVDNSASNAITTIGDAGWIISEGNIGNNRVKWNTGATNATFNVPFGLSTTHYLPLRVTTLGSVGDGSIIFSTFRTGVNSSNLPQAGTVIPQTMLPIHYTRLSVDNSMFGVDRFYQIDATDPVFTVKPTLSDITFSYATAEHDASLTPNTITESNIEAQYWDTTGVDDWSPISLGTTMTGSNTTTVSSHSALLVSSSKWWTLVDNAFLLPITLLDFTGECLNNAVEIKWVTASELNNDFFTIERSSDAINWQIISTVNGAGNSSSAIDYSFIDRNNIFKNSYYRLKQTDFDGTTATSSIIGVGDCEKSLSNQSTTVYFNTDQQNIQVIIDSDFPSNFSIMIYNSLGSLVDFKDIDSFIGENQIVFERLNKSDGFYTVVIRNSKNYFTHKIIISK
jgi:hypothetical protein